MTDAWTEDAAQVLRENTAQAIHQHLEELDNQKPQYARRWIWELFQNALDASDRERPTRVNIRCTEAVFEFSHNGVPFNRREILHLIFHGSTKREREGTIGRYGTGFLTSHIVSRKVRIRGDLVGDEHFDFVLNRCGRTPADLADAMESSLDELKRSLNASSGGDERHTTFEYEITESTRLMVATALADVSAIAPLVLLFNPALEYVEIDGAQRVRFQRLETVPVGSLGNLITIGDPDAAGTAQSFCHIQDRDVSVAVPLVEDDGSRAAFLPANVPRLFVAFPLFGTEQLPLPFILNCPSAKPTEQRDGLFLGANATDDNLENKRLVEIGWSIHRSVLDSAGQCGWTKLFNLAAIRPASPFAWLDAPWFESLARRTLVSCVVFAPLVETKVGLLPARAAIFPVPPSVDTVGFLRLAEALYGSRVPTEAIAQEWLAVVEAWQRIAPLTELDLKTPSIEDMAAEIASLRDLNGLESLLSKVSSGGASQPDAIEWLNSYLRLIIAAGQQRLLDKCNVLPDENGKFRTRSVLKRDESIDDQLKKIGSCLGKDLRAEFLDTRVDASVQALLLGEDSASVAETVASLLVTKTAAQYGTAAYREANTLFLSWAASNRKLDLVRRIPILSTELDSAGQERPAPNRDCLLAPINLWQESARKFSELFPNAHIASAAYLSAVDRLSWEWLEQNGVFLLDPVVHRWKDLQGDDLLKLIEQPLPANEEEKEHCIQGVEVIEPVHLELKDKGLLDGARNSATKCEQFLEFLVLHVLRNASETLKYRSGNCACGQSHSFYAAPWMEALKRRQWVFERRGHSGSPTAVNLARHWKESSDLVGAIADDATLLFLRRLDVSASDLVRHLSAASENEAAKMEKAIVTLITATQSDAQRITQLAEIVSSDPSWLKSYEEKLRQRARVRHNQEVGASVEQLFKRVFQAPELIGLGIRLERTGWGSDFCVEHDLLDDTGEVAFQLRTFGETGFLIELKSTFGSAVSMSGGQGRRAAERRDSFALCVVHLDEETADAAVIRDRARFVPDIGRLLKPTVDYLSAAESLFLEVASPADDIEILREGGDLHYRVKEPIWSVGLDFDGFIEFLMRFFAARAAD